ncbi:MAG TPA: PQQ-binding-like beta-propeller repeat protein [Thermoguttaceae bacterium]|nr:PQQ-binding-like beta-propeller repeat protein [Thermoguttaceae bacterium]
MMAPILRKGILGGLWVLATAVCLALPAAAWADRPDRGSSPEALASEILKATGVKGGLVVHLGCGDGRLTAALRANEKYTVHGLDRDAENVEAARQEIVGQGLYGPVSVEHLAGSTLPYADHLINLVVAEDLGSVSQEEILRVLAPRGVAYVKKGDGWEKIVKPRPDTIDEWTHFLHDAGNNAVARDTLVGPPRSLQWVAPPLWLRSHETPSGIEGLVSGGGRVFYFFDEGIVGITDQRLPERWSLVCHDAFNGKLLWKRAIEPWGWTEWARDRFEEIDWTMIRGGRTAVPNENQRRLVVDGDRLYATLGFLAPLAILDAATGEVLATVEGTEPVREILASDGVVLVYSRDPLAQTSQRRGDTDAGPSALAAVGRDSKKVLWKKEVRPINSLMLAVDGGRVVYQSGTKLTCLKLTDGQSLWETEGPKGRAQTLIACDGTVLLYSGNTLEARDAGSGEPLWRQDKVPSSAGGEGPDLFVTGGLVWRGMVAVDEDLKPIGKSADAMAVAYDLRTGDEKKRVVVRQLRSPEHHHRCYRNKATERYIISGMEGAEFLDLVGDDHCQNNWLRGACRHGVMPANGLLYVPADQCFCQPGAKFLGTAAVAGPRPSRNKEIADEKRLERGPAYESLAAGHSPLATPSDWPTFRHDPARHGSTSAAVPAKVATSWRADLGGKLTAPVMAGGRVYVASCDAHAVHALDAKTGKPVWKYTAGGRVDSPPTIYRDRVLFGSADGRVYCLRARDGALLWRFLAAPTDRRIGCFDQIESVWPVHGSVLVRDGVACVTAGRSTYVDGGIRLWGLDPLSGKVLHKGLLEGPFPDVETGKRDFAFYLTGANSDVLVSEGDSLYMRQKKLTPELGEVEVPVLSTKGAQDVGTHVFSTSGLLDGSWYNRTFWMYSKRWPGFQFAHQASKSGQLLVVDDENTYAVRVFYRRNVHSLMFFPGKEGYLLFADKNTNEPQIVGEPGWRKPLAWLPQSHIPREGNPGLESEDRGFGADKGIGYTRAEPPLWTAWIPIRIRAMVKAGDVLFVAGPPDVLEPLDPYAALEGRRGARLAAVSAQDGTKLAEQPLDAPPVFDGLIAAAGRLYLSLEDGSLVCLAPTAPGGGVGAGY